MERTAQTGPAVLVVDDDDALLNVFTLALRDEGYRVATAADGRKALAHLREHPVDLVLLDLRMPDMDGVAFAAAYRALPPPHAPIVLVTAADDPEANAASVGALAVLRKPFDLNEALDLVQRLTAGRRPA
jgi:CheY-like chemotaxis protein